MRRRARGRAMLLKIFKLRSMISGMGMASTEKRMPKSTDRITGLPKVFIEKNQNGCLWPLSWENICNVKTARKFCSSIRKPASMLALVKPSFPSR